MKRITLVTGGSRSGKSSYALELAALYSRRAFIATAEDLDEEMQARIERHRQQRGSAFSTIEQPLDPAAALGSLPENTEVAVLDCITVWLGNLTYHRKIKKGSSPEIEAFLQMLDSPPCDLILVTNEVGMGIVPEDPESRRFRDLAGSINQQVASRAHEVILTVCGIPVRIKQFEPEFGKR